jgi:methylated-DNA-[protein]-cysteine S-methyltransferase
VKRYWDFIATPFGTFAAWIEADGRLHRFRFHASDAARVEPDAEQNPGKLRDVRGQVDEYFAGTRKNFDLNLRIDDTGFESAVWHAMREIPFGETLSYGAIAKRIGNPRATREVGQGCGSNPIALIVPCHRVVGADGNLTGFGGGLHRKRWLLTFEGAAFRDKAA